MNEEKWLTSGDAFRMMQFISHEDGRNRSKAGRRKLRLFGCFSCRQLWEKMTDERTRRAVEVAEALADGQASLEEVKQTLASVIEARMAGARRRINSDTMQRRVTPDGWLRDDEQHADQAATTVLDSRVGNFACAGLAYSYGSSTPEYPIYLARRRAQADALRCIFGNPFRSLAMKREWLAWNDATLQRLARSLYDDRAWDQLPILADALEDAGCDDSTMLEHLRGSGPHTRGCWVVDLILEE